MSQQETKDMAKHFYRASAADFMKIPGSPVAYWAPKSAVQAFEKLHSLDDLLHARIALATADNDRFIRSWHEVSYKNIGFDMQDNNESIESGYKWFPCNKGGEYRKWYGNNDNVVNWFNDGEEVRALTDPETGRIRSHNYNGDFGFQESITWSALSSSKLGARYSKYGYLFVTPGSSEFKKDADINMHFIQAILSSKVAYYFLRIISATMNIEVGNLLRIPAIKSNNQAISIAEKTIKSAQVDWDSFEASWDFTSLPLLTHDTKQTQLRTGYTNLCAQWLAGTQEMQRLEQENNRIFINAYGLQDELTPDVPLNEITLTCNPHYRYGGDLTVQQREERLQSDTIAELISYAIGGMMGRYSLDKPGLILASQGETLQDYLDQIPSPSFAPDENAILPLTDQEWFPDDATNRFREFVRVAWGDEHLQENLDFVAQSLCLHAIKPKRGESALDTIRRYLSTQFYKDHLRTYKKRPIYWLFSSGKQKAFECLVYLHRYNESTLARMRTEYVIPLSAKLNAYADKLEQDIEASTSTAETKRLEKEITTLHKQQAELAEFDEKLRHYADQRISLDLDDGVKVNYGRFGDLLAEVKAVTGENPT